MKIANCNNVPTYNFDKIDNNNRFCHLGKTSEKHPRLKKALKIAGLVTLVVITGGIFGMYLLFSPHHRHSSNNPTSRKKTLGQSFASEHKTNVFSSTKQSYGQRFNSDGAIRVPPGVHTVRCTKNGVIIPKNHKPLNEDEQMLETRASK